APLAHPALPGAVPARQRPRGHRRHERPARVPARAARRPAHPPGAGLARPLRARALPALPDAPRRLPGTGTSGDRPLSCARHHEDATVPRRVAAAASARPLAAWPAALTGESSLMIPLENARVLVTGGAGFVGSNLVRRLLREGARVTVLDDLFTGRLENLPPKGCEFVQGSVCDATVGEKLVGDAQGVFHAAAAHIAGSTRTPREDFETNIGGTLNVLLAARATQGRVKRVLYTSSTSVYGNPRYLPINEDDHLSLLTPYAVSKLGGENYCMAFFESYDLP